MATRIFTTNHLAIAVLEPHGAVIGGEETDRMKSQSADLLDQGNRKLILDLSGVSYMNSSGLGAVVGIHSLYGQRGGRVIVCGLEKGVRNVFVLTSIMQALEVEETREHAMKRFEVE